MASEGGGGIAGSPCAGGTSGSAVDVEPRVRRGEGRAAALPLSGGHERALLALARRLHCIFFFFECHGLIAA